MNISWEEKFHSNYNEYKQHNRHRHELLMKTLLALPYLLNCSSNHCLDCVSSNFLQQCTCCSFSNLQRLINSTPQTKEQCQFSYLL